MQIKKSKIFVLTVIAVFFGSALLYMLSFHLLVSKDISVSHSYKQFLLEYTKSPRLIIESGSNSLHGINSSLLEKELGLVTINMGDNGGYPLKYKLLKIERYAHSGDVVLLPLEWGYYAYTSMPSIFLKNIFDQLNFYYNSLPWMQKLELLAETPFSGLVKAIFRSKRFSGGTSIIKRHREYANLLRYEKKFKNSERGDAGYSNGPMPLADGIEALTCEQYVLADLRAKGFFISDEFKKNIEIVKRLQKKGIKVIFTWPAVVGDDCYKGKSKAIFKQLVKDIKDYMKSNEIPLIAEPEDSNFSRKYILNTYYHVIADARDIRTKRLIETIKRSKISKWFAGKFNSSYKLNAPSSSMLRQSLLDSLDGMSSGELVRFGRKHNDNKAILLAGWVQRPGKHSIWSEGEKSALLVKLNKSLMGKVLKMEIGSFYYKAENKSKTEVFVNGKLVGDYLPTKKNEVIISEEIVKLHKSGKLKIEFYHTDVISPFEYGDSQDPTKLKLGLEYLKFVSLEKN